MMDYKTIQEVKAYVKEKAPQFNAGFVNNIDQAAMAGVDAVKQNNYLVGLSESIFIKLLEGQKRLDNLDDEIAAKLKFLDDERQRVTDEKLSDLISKVDALDRKLDSEKTLRTTFQERSLKDLREIINLSKSMSASLKDQKILEEIAKIQQEIVRNEAGQVRLRSDLEGIKSSVRTKLEHRDFETKIQDLQIALQGLMEEINQKQSPAPIDTTALDQIVEKFNKARANDEPVQKTWAWYHAPPIPKKDGAASSSNQ